MLLLFAQGLGWVFLFSYLDCRTEFDGTCEGLTRYCGAWLDVERDPQSRIPAIYFWLLPRALCAPSARCLT
jgi:hypothetical protein